MSGVFLSAGWKNLLMANYITEPKLLKPFVPAHTELDEFNGNYFLSLVGFLFENTKLRGLSVPFHRQFEEVNLRFYVRYRENFKWKRGVVFLKEIVPRKMITMVANTFYRENYATHRMKHNWQQMEDCLKVEYHWKTGGEWNYLKAIAENQSRPVIAGSEEEFITEHYWGYTHIRKDCTGTYEVRHPKWNIHKVLSYDILCNAEILYGKDFVDPLSQPPHSVFLAEGSSVQVLGGSRIYSTSG